jgi:sugar/nucleoside kinase (ribokinase family)
MNRYSALGLAFVLAHAAAATAQEVGDAVAVDPTRHHVILENDHVRVFEALASPGTATVMHTHPPFVGVSLSKARLRMAGPDGAPFIFDLNPGQVFWMEDAKPHEWELLAGQVHVIAVEPKGAVPGETRPLTPGRRDAVAVDPTLHHVILENDHVRVFEALASPGAATIMHTHPPFVGVSLSKARLRMAGPDGARFIFDLNPGQVFWMEDAEHEWELLAGQVHVIAMEPKAVPIAGSGQRPR